MPVDATNKEQAIERAELLLRRLRTGEITGFVAVTTDTEDSCGMVLGGRVNLTQTVCLLEHLKLLCLGKWMERFTDDDGSPAMGTLTDEDPIR